MLVFSSWHAWCVWCSNVPAEQSIAYSACALCLNRWQHPLLHKRHLQTTREACLGNSWHTIILYWLAALTESVYNLKLQPVCWQSEGNDNFTRSLLWLVSYRARPHWGQLHCRNNIANCCSNYAVRNTEISSGLPLYNYTSFVPSGWCVTLLHALSLQPPMVSSPVTSYPSLAIMVKYLYAPSHTNDPLTIDLTNPIVFISPFSLSC